MAEIEVVQGECCACGDKDCDLNRCACGNDVCDKHTEHYLPTRCPSCQEKHDEAVYQNRMYRRNGAAEAAEGRADDRRLGIL